ncbi:MAG: DUF3095 domain-containing protein, partial [Phototrophicaceae bacterium]
MNDPTRFYTQLRSLPKISAVTDPSVYVNIPTDWVVAITDVRGSTAAIQAGRYKEVNGIAAASITALINLVPGHDLPFVFGGDGATIVIPPSIVEEARHALIATQRLSRDIFELDLRVGLVPITDIVAGGFAVRVAKLHFSENFQQAVFSGGGLAYADRLIKDKATQDRYLLVDDGGEHHANFDGYECRWNEIPSAHEENLAIIIQATSSDAARNNAVYTEVIAYIEHLYGDTAARNPLSISGMGPGKSPWAFRVENMILQGKRSWLRNLWLFVFSWVGLLIWKQQGRWDKYLHVAAEATDREKFDDTLRMLMAGRPQQRQALRGFLEERRQRGELIYGIHVSTHALMTCVVFDRLGQQVHFVDGTGGGYALAAKEMKS